MSQQQRNYFADGSRIIDFVLVVDADITKNHNHLQNISSYLHWLHDRGVDVEMNPGMVTNCIFIKLHMTDIAVQHFAEVYNVDLKNSGHNYNIEEPRIFRCNPAKEDNFIRQSEEPTIMERILIISQVLKDAKFSNDDTSVGMDKLIAMGVLKTAYPLHDPEKDTLEKIWANFRRSLFKEQPLNLIEKYFGAEVAFYFAWFGFYTKMLVPAAVVGIVAFLASLIILLNFPINYVLEYKESLKKKKEGRKMEPLEFLEHGKFFQYLISYGVFSLLLVFVLLVLFAIIVFKVYLSEYCKTSNINFFATLPIIVPLAVSSMIQTVFVKLFAVIYAPMSIWLTKAENPRTQSEFDDLVVYKRFLLGFLNNCTPLIYMSFIKGEWPAIPRSYTGFQDIMLKDTCRPTNCIFHVAMLLLFYMLFKSMLGNVLILFVPDIIKMFQRTQVSTVLLPQWEEEFYLLPTNRYFLTTEFMELIMQYCLLSLFGCAFPLAATCALINNIMEIRLDAIKLIKRYRRPIPRKTVGIGPWNLILQCVTYVGLVAFVMAFTSDVVSRELYRYNHSTLKGYINFTLSKFDVSNYDLDYVDFHNVTTCYYTAYRYPPKHENEYRLSTYYWKEFSVRLICVAFFEHFIFLLNWLLSYAIPDVPRSVKKQLRYQLKKEREQRIAHLKQAVQTKAKGKSE